MGAFWRARAGVKITARVIWRKAFAASTGFRYEDGHIGTVGAIALSWRFLAMHSIGKINGWNIDSTASTNKRIFKTGSWEFIHRA
jgi:hypothetical protein